jgi:hypothetical protein
LTIDDTTSRLAKLVFCLYKNAITIAISECRKIRVPVRQKIKRNLSPGRLQKPENMFGRNPGFQNTPVS